MADPLRTTDGGAPKSRPQLRHLVPALLCVLAVLAGGGAALAATSGATPGGRATSTPLAPVGYWLAASDGGVFSFGDAAFHGSTGAMVLNRPVVGMAATPDGGGYWLVASDGGVFSFGDAAFHGSTGDRVLNSPVVGMAATPDGGGYWLVAADGGVFTFGDATFHGSTGDRVLASPVVDMAATPDGGGYWLAAADGGVFAFGDAPFEGSAVGAGPTPPVGSIAAGADGRGYWLSDTDGGVHPFGDAAFHGSVVGLTGGSPVVDLEPAPGGSYWAATADGGVFALGDTPFFGSAAGLTLRRPVVGMATDVQPAAPPQAFTLSGSVTPYLWPGGRQPIDLVIANHTRRRLTVVQVRTMVATGSRSCPPSDFPVSPGFVLPVTVPAGATASLSALGVAPADWPSLAMPDTGADQDACEGLHLTLHYRGEAVG